MIGRVGEALEIRFAGGKGGCHGERRVALNTNIVIAEERLAPPCPATTVVTRTASGCPRAFAIPLSSSQKAHSREMLVRWPATLSECWTIFPAASRCRLAADLSSPRRRARYGRGAD
jgi:hypothetical protein